MPNNIKNIPATLPLSGAIQSSVDRPTTAQNAGTPPQPQIDTLKKYESNTQPPEASSAPVLQRPELQRQTPPLTTSSAPPVPEIRTTLEEKRLSAKPEELHIPDSLVSAPPASNAVPLKARFNDFAQHGDSVLVMIPTGNKFKVRVLTEVITQKVHAQYPGRKVIIQQLKNAQSGVGEQPYNEAGPIGARQRLESGFDILFKDHKALLEREGIGTVLGASIENFIELGKGQEHAVDYGAITICNASTGETRVTLSEGVKVPKLYLSKARSLGSEDEAGLFGKITVGEVIAANTGADKANWHPYVCGKSRYDILEEAAAKVDLPF